MLFSLSRQDLAVSFLPQDETQALDLDAAVKRVVDNDGVGANYDPNPLTRTLTLTLSLTLTLQPELKPDPDPSPNPNPNLTPNPNSNQGANYDADKDEWGGPKGQEPTRFGDWEVKGRASDF